MNALLVTHRSKNSLKPLGMISLAEYILHGVNRCHNAGTIACIRNEINIKSRSEIGVLEITDGQIERGEHFGQAELVRVIDGQ